MIKIMILPILIIKLYTDSSYDADGCGDNDDSNASVLDDVADENANYNHVSSSGADGCGDNDDSDANYNHVVYICLQGSVSTQTPPAPRASSGGAGPRMKSHYSPQITRPMPHDP